MKSIEKINWAILIALIGANASTYWLLPENVVSQIDLATLEPTSHMSKNIFIVSTIAVTFLITLYLSVVRKKHTKNLLVNSIILIAVLFVIIYNTLLV